MNKHSSDNLVISYLKLRKIVGFLGVSLPFLLYFGGLILFDSGLKPSVSGYYYTGVGNVLVGTLCVIGCFLYSYKGYDAKDNIAGNLACIFAVGVAFCPTSTATVDQGIIGYIHLASALLFFIVLIYFSLFLFTKTSSSKPPTPQKIKRNKVYKTCGYTMSGCIILLIGLFLLPDNLDEALDAYGAVFWLEAIAIIAFGISWLTKGEALLSD